MNHHEAQHPMNTTTYSYSRDEVEEARDGLKLLKSRMANMGLGIRKSTSNSAA